mgnify:CR=1 FL=1
MANIINKKAEATIITTVLLILLVLASIVIVWGVINRTVSEGSKKIQQQSQCIDLVIDITKIDLASNNITIRPSKKINGYKIYVNGEEATTDNNETTIDDIEVDAFSTPKIESRIDIEAGDEIEVLGKLGDIYCTSGTKKLAEN